MKQKKKVLFIRAEQELIAKIKNAALADKRSLSTWCVVKIIEALKEKGD